MKLECMYQKSYQGQVRLSVKIDRRAIIMEDCDNKFNHYFSASVRSPSCKHFSDDENEHKQKIQQAIITIEAEVIKMRLNFCRKFIIDDESFIEIVKIEE